MKKIFPILATIFLSVFFFVSFSPRTQAQETPNNYLCGVYFTGVGCPHCAKTDPYVLKSWLKKYPNFIVIEYEIYQQKQNASLLFNYDQTYQSGLGIPSLVFGKSLKAAGDQPIINGENSFFQKAKINPCPLADGREVSFSDLKISSLVSWPKIWTQDKILIKDGEKGDDVLLKNLLTQTNLTEILKDKNYKKIQPKEIALSGQNVTFENAIKIDDWIFQWNGKKIEGEDGSTGTNENNNQNNQTPASKLTIAKIISLATVDAINPCAFAVLILMLISILTYDPTKRKNVLWAGLAFVTSVFIMYFVYGIIIIKFFQIIQALTSFRIILYKVVAILAIVLGLLNLKDFIKYKPGGFLTEMPMFIRPLAKKLLGGITSPAGAFGVGAFVTLFLLPCTIGPYIICGSILSTFDFFKTLPYLSLYNFVFVLPMIFIVLIVYKGFAKVQDVSGWKDKNIRYLHLTAGLIMLVLGLGMFLGWF